MIDFEELRGLTHREAAGRLLAAGWDVSGTGDWAVVWRSPDGARVARVCAFEPAYGIFVRLCRDLAGHPMLPGIDFDTELSGGGRITVMEFLRPAEAGEAASVKERWETAAADDPIAALRREAERLDAEAAAACSFWGGLDFNPGNVMRREDGDLLLLDLFYANGPEIYRVLLEDPAKIAAAFPAEKRRFLCEIAAIARGSTTRELAELRAAAAAIG